MNYNLRGIRLDSGNLVSVSKKVREISDENGLPYVTIFASGDLDEYKIKELLKNGGKIDAFGVGTKMSTSSDRPFIDVVYKLSGKTKNGDFVPAMKLSKDKITIPGKKQIFRQRGKREKYAKDIIGLEEEKITGDPLLVKVVEKGEIVYDLPSLKKIRENTVCNLTKLPEKYKRLKKASVYPVELSLGIKKMQRQLLRKYKKLLKE